MEESSADGNEKSLKSTDFLHEAYSQHSFLRRLFNQSRRSEQGLEGREKTLAEIQTRIENNIETLDYLRGISCLERDFVSLADKVIKASLQLSHECKNINRDALNSTQLLEEVDTSWQHVTHMGNILQIHVKHAKRYHFLALEMENFERTLNEMESRVNGLEAMSTVPSEAAINEVSSEIHQLLESLVQAFVAWQKISQRAATVSPLHRRMPLPSGLHSGVLLTSISLSPTSGGAERILRAGTRVQVRASRPADLMHREWFLVDRTKGKESGGLVIASVPAAFVWLDSPEPSPERTADVGEAADKKVEVRRCQSASAVPRELNNIGMVENLRKRLFGVWEESCSKFGQILREMSIALFKIARTESRTVLSEEAVARVKKALQKVAILLAIVEERQEDGTTKLAQLLDSMKLRGEIAGVDVKAADALVQAIDIFEEMIICCQRYGSMGTLDGGPEHELQQPWCGKTEGFDVTSKAAMESLQSLLTPLQAQSTVSVDAFTSKESKTTSSKTPDLTKSRKSPRRKYRHRSLTADGFDTETNCPYSPYSSAKSSEHNVALASRSKPSTTVTESRSISRSRKRERFYRLLPILLRRHTQNKKKKGSKMSDDGESGFSDTETSNVGSRLHSTSPKRGPQTYESLTLGRVNYMKKSDFAKFHRSPLLFSTSALLNPTGGNLTSTATSTLRRQVPPHEDESTPRPPILYSVACQNGVCLSSTLTGHGQPVLVEPSPRKFGKKLQVGKSFTSYDFYSQAEKTEEDERREQKQREETEEEDKGRRRDRLKGEKEDVEEEEEEEGEEEEKDYNQSSHVYANIIPRGMHPLEQANIRVELFDIGVQADLPNRLRGLRCRLEFEQPGVELANNAFKEHFDSIYDIDAEARGDGGGGGGGVQRDFKTLSFRVAFNNKPAGCASTI